MKTILINAFHAKVVIISFFLSVTLIYIDTGTKKSSLKLYFNFNFLICLIICLKFTEIFFYLKTKILIVYSVIRLEK